jgi:uncharacterized protein DUF5995
VLEKILRPVTSIEEAIATMTAIEQALASSDGVRWFNHLYLRVTLGVQTAIGGSTPFHDPEFLARLDVVFANLYFDAIRAAEGDVEAAPPAWRPLLAGRHARDVHPVQFALAGMDAHINRDLPAGIVSVYEQLGGAPTVLDARHDDFDRVNGILESVERDVKTEFATGKIGAIDALTAPVDDRIAMWNVRAARATAWTNAAVMWTLKPTPVLAHDFFTRLDRFTGFSARGLLAPVIVHGAARDEATAVEREGQGL